MLYDCGKIIYDTFGPLNLTLGVGVMSALWLWRDDLFGGWR